MMKVNWTLIYWLVASSAQASPLELYARCYSQITGLVAPINSADIVAVKAGSLSPADACSKLIIEAELVGSIGVVGNSNAVTRATLSNMHALHGTWFSVKDIPQALLGRSRFGALNVYDSSAPALYFTKALFGKAVAASSILTGSANLIPIRTDNDPATPHYRGNVYTKLNTAFTNLKFAPKGELLGVAESGNMATDWAMGPNSGTANFGRTFGGGVIGSPVFITKPTGLLPEADGAEILPRRWARDVFKDLLCRDLPMVTLQDAASFVDANSDVSFRQIVNCAVCHASMDQATGTIRNLRFDLAADENDTPNLGAYFLATHPTTMPSEIGWPAQVDSQFFKRPTKGRLYYRSVDNVLIDRPLVNVESLASAILSQDDFYVCMAKRYFEYFTGISVSIDPLTGENNPIRQNVVALGKALKVHQRVPKLITDILKSDAYKASSEASR